jgi:3-deoxy-D-manno-octulosonic-acid transferase
MGEMLVLMSAADVCFMGGSLIGNKVGGHNVLEPAAIGIPVITGPSYFNFEEIVNLLISKQAINVVTKSSELTLVLNNQFDNPKACHEQKQRLNSVVTSNLGAISKTLRYVRENQYE